MGITARQFEQIQSRLGATKRTPKPVFETAPRPGGREGRL